MSQRPEMLVTDARPGAIIKTDDGFYDLKYGLRCFRAERKLRVKIDTDGDLFVRCMGCGDLSKRSAGRHYLDGQLTDDGERLVGFTLHRSAP